MGPIKALLYLFSENTGQWIDQERSLRFVSDQALLFSTSNEHYRKKTALQRTCRRSKLRILTAEMLETNEMPSEAFALLLS